LYASIFSVHHRPPTPTLFPYTTLFRSYRCATSVIERTSDSTPVDVSDWATVSATNDFRLSASSTAFRSKVWPHGTTTRSTWRLQDRKSTRLNSSHRTISYAVLCLKKKM